MFKSLKKFSKSSLETVTNEEEILRERYMNHYDSMSKTN